MKTQGVVLCALAAVVCSTACGLNRNRIQFAPWETWSWRDPINAAEWRDFYPDAQSRLNSLCESCQRRKPSSSRRRECITQCANGAEHLRRAFLTAHPNLDATTVAYVQTGEIFPTLDADTAVDEARGLEDHKARAEQARAAQQAREAELELKAEQARRTVGSCEWIFAQKSKPPCITANAQYQVGWHGQGLGTPVALRACITSFAQPFDLRLVNPGTGETTLLSLNAVDGIALASTEAGSCVDRFKMLLTDDAVESLGLTPLNYVSARLRGTYQGLYPRRDFTNGMEPTWLLIRAIEVEPTSKRIDGRLGH